MILLRHRIKRFKEVACAFKDAGNKLNEVINELKSDITKKVTFEDINKVITTGFDCNGTSTTKGNGCNCDDSTGTFKINDTDAESVSNKIEELKKKLDSDLTKLKSCSKCLSNKFTTFGPKAGQIADKLYLNDITLIYYT